MKQRALSRGWLVSSLWLASLGAAAAGEPADWTERVQLGALVVGDAYWAAEHHDPAIDGANGFWVWRLYSTVDGRIAEGIDARLRFEGHSPGDFTTSDNIEVFVKDLWVRWMQGRHEIYVGLNAQPHVRVDRGALGLPPRGEDAARSVSLAIVGLDLHLADHVNLIPNVEAVFYDATSTGADPCDDLFLRLTLFVAF